MKRKAIATGALAALVCALPQAMAVAKEKDRFQPMFGAALPPVGYVDFCRRFPAECQKTGRDTERVAMNAERWKILRQVNTHVNEKIAPVSDQDLYGQAEYWAYPTDAGDCEDFLLLKKRYLEGLGFPSSALLITVVLDEKGEGHAVLTVATDGGDYVLDNRRDAILRWSDTRYRFLKRQSWENPTRWVALAKTTPTTTGAVRTSPAQEAASQN
jgi:predicted transglutaminase-like cysteine proteinase